MDLSLTCLLLLSAAAILSALKTPIFDGFRYLSRRKAVGPSYWGVYNGSAQLDNPGTTTIQLQKPSLSQLVNVGGSSYVLGKAIKSARSK